MRERNQEFDEERTSFFRLSPAQDVPPIPVRLPTVEEHLGIDVASRQELPGFGRGKTVSFLILPLLLSLPMSDPVLLRPVAERGAQVPDKVKRLDNSKERAWTGVETSVSSYPFSPKILLCMTREKRQENRGSREFFVNHPVKYQRRTRT